MRFLIATSFFGGLTLWVAMGIASLRHGSFAKRSKPPLMVFRRRRSYRIFTLAVAVGMGWGAPWVGWSELHDYVTQLPPPPHGAEYVSALTYAWLYTIIGIVIGGWGLSQTAVEELRLDMDRRTYRLVRGWPPLARIWSGSLDDCSGIYIKDVGRGSHAICLGWNQPGRRFTLIGYSGKSTQAVQMARELADQMGLATINPPR